MPDSLFVLGQHLFGDDQFDSEPLTLAWADAQERERVIDQAQREGRQTMNLRTMPGAKLVVLRRPGGLFAGWAGVDVDTHPRHPEVFSQFVYPQFRNRGLGSLLEHFWWAYLSFRGRGTAYMRMDLDTNQTLVERRLRSSYCRRVCHDELGELFAAACRKCELFGKACRLQIYLEVDVRKALTASTEARGAFHVGSLPLYIPPKQEVCLPFQVQREVLPVRF